MKKRLVVAIVGGLITLSAGAGYLLKFVAKARASTPEAQREALLASCKDNRPLRDDPNECIAAEALRWMKAEYCDLLVTEQKEGPSLARANCRADVAIRGGDVELCKASGAEASTQRCLSELVRLLEDPELCALSSQPGDCIDRLAFGTSDTSFCGRIPELSLRDHCYRQRSPEGGLAACDEIVDAGKRAECVSKVARGSEDGSVCQALPLTSRGDCWRGSGAAPDDVSATCEGSPECLAGFAYLGPAVCDAIPAEKAFLHAACLDAALKARGSEGPTAWLSDSLCANLKQESVREKCFALLGAREERPSACGKVKDARLRNECWLAAGRWDAAYCRKLPPLDQPECVRLSVHRRTLDSSVCGALTPDGEKACKERVLYNVRSGVPRAF